MNFRERKIAYEQLKGAAHLEADKALLAKIQPGHRLLSTNFKPERLQAEILYELLGFDNVTRDMVVKNRREMNGPSQDEINEKVEKIKELTKGILKVKNKEEREKALDEIELLIPGMPVPLAKELFDAAVAVKPEYIQKRMEADRAIVKMDLKAAAQKDMAKLVRALNLETKDMKGDTIRPVLVAYKEKLLSAAKTNNTPDSEPAEEEKKS